MSLIHSMVFFLRLQFSCTYLPFGLAGNAVGLSAGAPNYHFDRLSKLHKRGPTLVASLEPLGHCRNIANVKSPLKVLLL